MRAGHTVCKKIKLKNFYDAKPAGGCGVAPFLSVRRLFCRAVDAPAPRSARDRVEGICLRGCEDAWFYSRPTAFGGGNRNVTVLSVIPALNDKECFFNEVLRLSLPNPYVCKLSTQQVTNNFKN